MMDSLGVTLVCPPNHKDRAAGHSAGVARGDTDTSSKHHSKQESERSDTVSRIPVETYKSERSGSRRNKIEVHITTEGNMAGHNFKVVLLGEGMAHK